MIPILCFGSVVSEDFCKSLDKIKDMKTKELIKIENEAADIYASLLGIEHFLEKKLLKQAFYYSLATCFLDGKHVPKSFEKGKHFIKLAAKSGYQPALHVLASLNLFGPTSKEEKEKGYEFLKKEYLAGSAYSGGKLGLAYHFGFYVAKNDKKALELYEYAATYGMTKFQYILAHSYEKGYYGLPINNAKTKYWLEYKPKIHILIYECETANNYNDGTFPDKPELYEYYNNLCLNKTSKVIEKGKDNSS